MGEPTPYPLLSVAGVPLLHTPATPVLPLRRRMHIVRRMLTGVDVHWGDVHINSTPHVACLLSRGMLYKRDILAGVVRKTMY